MRAQALRQRLPELQMCSGPSGQVVALLPPGSRGPLAHRTCSAGQGQTSIQMVVKRCRSLEARA